ncbi:MAG: hypothetical protein QG587_1003, partial [Chloroflexota bacterium]|nr:hypothetical protein [Chloroflexota bacterium]
MGYDFAMTTTTLTEATFATTV